MNLDRDSHAKAHLRMKAHHTPLKYAWQKLSHISDEGDHFPKKMQEEILENVEPQREYR